MMEQFCVGQINSTVAGQAAAQRTGGGGVLHALHIICARSASRISFAKMYSYAIYLHVTASVYINTDSFTERCHSAAPLFGERM